MLSRIIQSEPGVLPAHAGMIRLGMPAEGERGGAPRARGDDPPARIYDECGHECSPRTRG